MKKFIQSLEYNKVEQPSEALIVSNLDPELVRLVEYDGEYSFVSLNGNEAAGILRNSVRTEATQNTGTFEFVGLGVVKNMYTNHQMGVYMDADNRIEFYRSTLSPFNMNYRIVLNGTTVYEIQNVFWDFIIARITVTSTTITLFLWDGNQWVKNGDDHPVVMDGQKFAFFGTRGGKTSKVQASEMILL